MPTLRNTIKLVGDRLLIKLQEETKTTGGILIPETVKDEEDTASGIVVRVGPGFLQGSKSESVEDWMKEETPEAHHVPLQIKNGFKVVYFRKMAAEVSIDGEKYHVIPQSGVLIYDEDPFKIGVA